MYSQNHGIYVGVSQYSTEVSHSMITFPATILAGERKQKRPIKWHP